MNVQLIVVQGKPEGKVIPLVGPKFKIGRGETCHLRPNSEQVSREHAEFSLTADTVSVRDLGSRNGTLVNGKALTEPCVLKDRDLVQVGPLTFAVSILGAPASANASAPRSPAKATPEDVSHDDIEAWLIADSKNAAPERPSGVYGGDTITITAFKDKDAAASRPAPAASKPAPSTPNPAPAAPKPAAAAPKPAAAAPKPAAAAPKPAPAPSPLDDDSDEEYERLPEGEGDTEEMAAELDDEGGEETEPAPEEFIDESNPFYVKKKAPETASPTNKQTFKDTSDAASDILRKMMERRRGSH